MEVELNSSKSEIGEPRTPITWYLFDISCLAKLSCFLIPKFKPPLFDSESQSKLDWVIIS